ncbi:MAG TPA: UvrD-helicase domain-containing protein, partial [Dehalococcoidia bacterium]|nr:UvrD-helicase domain-containing protein [Dehalococcoidia bacterium]
MSTPAPPSDLLAGLNPAQRRAVEVADGALLILAGPGSGKTRVISHRIAHLILEGETPPYRILAVTFTNKAARELRERVESLVGDAVREMALGTFHSICARILRIEGERIGLDRGFNIYDDDDQIRLMKEVLSLINVDPRQFTPRMILSRISHSKSELVDAAAFASRARNYFDEVCARAYKAYETALHNAHAVDFDDLLLKAVELFRRHPDVLQKYADRYLHILIDEFQDTNIVQYVLAKQLAGVHGNICVVGDPDQSIYSWRSADIRNIQNFEQDFPDCQIVLLEENYRSTQTILDVAHSVISAHPGRKRTERMSTQKGEGSSVVGFEAYDEGEEATFITAELRRLQRDESLSHRDFAVMYRTNAQSRTIEEAFIENRIPYRLVGGTRFYERREVRDILAYLRLAQNPFDTVSLLRVINVPSRGIGERSLEAVRQWAQSLDVPLYTSLQLLNDWRNGEFTDAQPPQLAPRSLGALLAFLDLLNRVLSIASEHSPADLIEAVANEVDYHRYLLANFDDSEERWENIEELKNLAAQHALAEDEPSLLSFLEEVALISDQDTLDERKEGATLITLHAAKGLEFPVVFMAGLEEGILPHIRSFESPEQMDEERRLCYVGMTRAKDHLYLLRAMRRFRGGMSSANPPSRYWKDLPEALVEMRTRSITDPDLRSRPRIHRDGPQPR